MSLLIIPSSLKQLYFKQYHVIAKINNYILPVLIDTGSSISCIQSKYCQELYSLETSIKVSRIYDPKYDIKSSTIVNISFDNKFYFDLSLLVHDSANLDIPVLLGIDFLDVLQYYMITYEYLYLTINNYQLEIPRIMLTQEELIEQLEL